jgi:hypothetical protein
MPAAHAPAKSISHELPQSHRPWTDSLQDWKIDALRRVNQQLQHTCSGPLCHAKSHTLTLAVQHVVASEADPDSVLGLHLQHLLSGAIAREIARREDLLPEFHKRFPGNAELSPAFLTKYVNSRWWCEVVCELEQTNCRDLMDAVAAAIAGTEEELDRC